MPFTYLFLKVLKTAPTNVILRIWTHCAKHDPKVLHQLIKRLANFQSNNPIAHSFDAKSLTEAGMPENYDFGAYVKDLLFDKNS